MKRTDNSLCLTARPPFNAGAIAIALISGAMAGKRLWLAFQGQVSLPLLSTLFLIGVFLFAVTVLVLNLVVDEKILIVSGRTASNSGIPCSEIVTVKVIDKPYYLSKEWSSSIWGWGGHRLLLETNSGVLRFGRGISSDTATAMLQQIEAFCGRQFTPS